MAKFFTKHLLPGPVWLHFLLLGAALYAALAALYPEPKPVLGPPNPTRLEVMSDSYAKMVGGFPRRPTSSVLLILSFVMSCYFSKH